jgi:hypothetical protein
MMVKQKSSKTNSLVDEKWKHAPNKAPESTKSENYPHFLTTRNFYDTERFQS